MKMSVIPTYYREIRDTCQTQYNSIVWLFDTVIEKTGRTYIARSMATLVVVMLISTSIPYVSKLAVDALSTNDREFALTIIICILVLMLVTRWLEAYQQFSRELAWNANYRSVVTNLTRLYFSRTAGEMTTEKNEVGSEQIESAKDKIQNILFMLLFDGPIHTLGILATIVLVFSIDVVSGLGVALLAIINIVWFLVCTHAVNNKMESVDEGFRRANRRMIDRWNFFLSTKTNGVEKKMTGYTEDEIIEPLEKDKSIWAYWFIPVDACRGSVNAIICVLIMYQGVKYQSWSSGDFAAIFLWLYSVIDRLGFIGHIMRHFTSQVVRIQAVKDYLTTNPPFRFDEGIEYQPEGGM